MGLAKDMSDSAKKVRRKARKLPGKSNVINEE